jgi:hypothetical protein
MLTPYRLVVIWTLTLLPAATPWWSKKLGIVK